MNCRACEYTLPADAVFCPECGVKVEGAREGPAILRGMPEMIGKLKPEPGVAEGFRAEVAALLAEHELLASDLAPCKNREDVKAIAWRWRDAPPGPPYEGIPEIDMDDFIQGAGQFVPTQAMRDEDWSALTPKKDW